MLATVQYTFAGFFGFAVEFSRGSLCALSLSLSLLDPQKSTWTLNLIPKPARDFLFTSRSYIHYRPAGLWHKTHPRPGVKSFHFPLSHFCCANKQEQTSLHVRRLPRLDFAPPTHFEKHCPIQLVCLSTAHPSYSFWLCPLGQLSQEECASQLPVMSQVLTASFACLACNYSVGKDSAI